MSRHFVKKAKGISKVGRILEVCVEGLEPLWGREKGVKSPQGPDLWPFEGSAHGLNGHKF